MIYNFILMPVKYKIINYIFTSNNQQHPPENKTNYNIFFFAISCYFFFLFAPNCFLAIPNFIIIKQSFQFNNYAKFYSHKKILFTLYKFFLEHYNII